MKLRSSKRAAADGRVVVARYRPRSFAWLFFGREMIRVDGQVVTFFNGDAP